MRMRILLFSVVFLNWRWAIWLWQRHFPSPFSSKDIQASEERGGKDRAPERWRGNVQGWSLSPKRFSENTETAFFFCHQCKQAQDPTEHLLRIAAMWSVEVLCDQSLFFFLFLETLLISFRNVPAGRKSAITSSHRRTRLQLRSRRFWFWCLSWLNVNKNMSLHIFWWYGVCVQSGWIGL